MYFWYWLLILWGLNGEECIRPNDVDIVLLMDAMPSLPRSDLAGPLTDFVKDFNGNAALYSFVNKPIPGLAVGNYGGWPKEDWDWCLRQELSFSSDFSELEKKIKNFPYGNGLMTKSGVWQALLQLAVDPVWTSETKLVVMVTDRLPNANYGDEFRAKEAVEAFNQEIVCEGGNTYGGFGSYGRAHHSVTDKHWHNYLDYNDEYQELQAVTWHAICGEPTEEHLERREELLDFFAPINFSPDIKPFDRDVLRRDPDASCKEHEYPTYDEINEMMDDINLVILAVGDTNSVAYNGWKWLVEDGPLIDMKSVNLVTYDETHSPLSDLIAAANDMLCDTCLNIFDRCLDKCEMFETVTQHSQCTKECAPPTDCSSIRECTDECSYFPLLDTYLQCQSDCVILDIHPPRPPEPSTSTTEPSTSTTEESTSTTEPSTSTTEPSTSTTEPSTSTTETSTSTTEESTSTSEPSTSTSEPSTSTTEESTSTTEASTSTSEPSTSTTEPSTSTSEPSTSTTEESTSTTEPSTSTSEPSTSTTETSTSTTEPSTSTSEPSTLTTETSTSTAEPSTSTTEESASTTEATTSTQQPSTSESSSTTVEASSSFSTTYEKCSVAALNKVMDVCSNDDLDHMLVCVMTHEEMEGCIGLQETAASCADASATSDEFVTCVQTRLSTTTKAPVNSCEGVYERCSDKCQTITNPNDFKSITCMYECAENCPAINKCIDGCAAYDIYWFWWCMDGCNDKGEVPTIRSTTQAPSLTVVPPLPPPNGGGDPDAYMQLVFAAAGIAALAGFVAWALTQWLLTSGADIDAIVVEGVGVEVSTVQREACVHFAEQEYA